MLDLVPREVNTIFVSNIIKFTLRYPCNTVLIAFDYVHTLFTFATNPTKY